MGYFDKTLFQSYNSKEKAILENELRFPNRFVSMNKTIFRLIFTNTCNYFVIIKYVI